MPRTASLVQSSYSRLFIIEDTAGPHRVPQYMGLGKLTGASKNFGDVSPIWVPSNSQYGKFDIVDQMRGEEGMPEASAEYRYEYDLSKALRIGNKGCLIDIQAHIGKCATPTDFDGGWEKVLIMEYASTLAWNAPNLGALDSGENAVVNEQVSYKARNLYEVVKLSMNSVGDSVVTDEILDIAICDAPTCGACGLASDGCSVVFALQGESSGSPGIGAAVVWTKDGGANWFKSPITSLAIGTAVDRIECVGAYVVVSSSAGGSIHYALAADIVVGAPGWTAVTTGVVATHGPKAIFSLDREHTWFSGLLGYIYFSADITGGVGTTQSAGSVTVQTINEIHGYDEDNLIFVGQANAMGVSRNGGLNWGAITGPAPAVALNTCYMVDANVWYVGDANGNLWYTSDAGVTWTAKTFQGSGTGQVRSIDFSTHSVGYIAHDIPAVGATPARGYVHRTINGGASWRREPGKSGALSPNNTRLNRVAACWSTVNGANVAFAVGLGTDGNDGIIAKLA